MNVLGEENRTKIGFGCFNNSCGLGRAEESQAQNYECITIFLEQVTFLWKIKIDLNFHPVIAHEEQKSRIQALLCRIYFEKKCNDG